MAESARELNSQPPEDGGSQSIPYLPPLADLLVRDAVADVVDALEGGDDLLVVGDDDDGGVVLARHAVEDADDGERAR